MPEKIAFALAAVAVLFLIGGLVVSVLHSWMHRRTARAIEATAAELGLVRAAGEQDASRIPTYEGVVGSVPVRIGSAWRLVHAIGTPYLAYVNEVGIAASLPRPLSFHLEVRRRAIGLPRTLTLLEKGFDRDCAIVTDDAEAVRSLFSSPELRSSVRYLVKSWVRVSRISSAAVITTVFNAHTKGAPAVTAAARQAAALALDLSNRGAERAKAPEEGQWEVIEGIKRIPNLVTILELNRIRIEGMTNDLRAALAEGSFRPSWKTITLSGEPAMIRAAEILSARGALFAGDSHGWPPADVLLELRERGRFPRPFTEVRFRGPGRPVLLRH